MVSPQARIDSKVRLSSCFSISEWAPMTNTQGTSHQIPGSHRLKSFYSRLGGTSQGQLTAPPHTLLLTVCLPFPPRGRANPASSEALALVGRVHNLQSQALTVFSKHISASPSWGPFNPSPQGHSFSEVNT